MTYFRRNDARVIHDTIDGEVVMINLENGNYYTMNDAAAFLWSLLSDGVAEDTAARELAARYSLAPEDVAIGVKSFFDHLKKEDLVLPCPAGGVSSSNAQVTAPFEAPTLYVFDDMQELLLLDPVHEISEQGWPHIKESSG